MTDHSGVLIESQVDWLTASAHGRETTHQLCERATAWAGEEKAKGNKYRKWHLMGYEGIHCGAVEWGTRDDAAAIIRLIGNAADIHLLEAFEPADRVTRVDLAVTYRPAEPRPELGETTYRQLEAFHRSKPNSALPWRVSDANGGYTAYLGAPGSEYLLRVYNKGAEAIAKKDKDGIARYKDCWRYELEVKGTIPLPLVSRILTEPDRAKYVQAYVHGYLWRHGVNPPFDAAGGAEILPGFRRRADADSRIAHLAKNVRPTVAFLREAGRLEDALTALGLESG